MIELINVSKYFGEKEILKDLSSTINKGDFVCIVGDSGCGKTTIINVLSLLEKVDAGTIIINGIKNPSKKEIMKLRRKTIGNIFQNYALIENESIKDNLKIAVAYHKENNNSEAFKQALRRVHLENIDLDTKIYTLSGGEQQRVAIARVILQSCDYIFADEPTGNLDETNREIIFELLKDLHAEGKTIILVTHDPALSQRCERIIKL